MDIISPDLREAQIFLPLFCPAKMGLALALPVVSARELRYSIPLLI